MSIDLGSAYGKIVIDASGVDQGAKKAQSALSSFGSSAAKAMAGLSLAVGGVGVAMAGVSKIAGDAFRTIERGAELDAARGRFDKLSASINTTSDSLLTRLRAATNGMMTDAALIASATDIMSLGLGKTEDQTVRLASVVGKLGWDMQQVVLTMANNSKMRLDALGLSVEDVDARVAKLRETGMSLDEAFDLAVIEAGEAKIELLGDSSQTTAGKIKQLQAMVGNVQDAFAAAFSDQVVAQIDAIGDSTEQLGQDLEYAAVGAGKLAGSLTKPFFNLAVGLGKMEEVRALGQEYQALGGDLSELQRKYQALFSGRLRDEEEQAAVESLRAEIEALKAAAAKREAYNKILEAGSEIEQKMADDADRRRRKEATATEETTRAIKALYVSLTIGGERLKTAADASGKLSAGMDGITAAARRAKDELTATEEAASRAAAAFGAVQADYTTELPQGDEPLVTPERTVSVVTQISGPTEAQRQAVVAYNNELEKLRERYTELTTGIGTYGMEQGELDEAIAETAGEIANYEGLLANIPPAVNDVSTSQQGLKVNVDAVKQGIYDQLVEMQAAPEIIAAYAAATGIMTDAQAKAVLQAAAVKVKIDELATSIAAGMPIEKAMADLDAFILKMEQGVPPAAEAMSTTVPQDVTDMGLAMWDEAITAGENVPTGVAQGINDSLETATTAATDAADAITNAVRSAHGIESPSSVFAEIGGQDIAGFIEGVESAQGDAVAAMEAVGQATVDAWDETIAAADGIGTAIMDGVIAGVEAKRGELVAKMQEIAREAYAAAMTEINAHSPSRLFMQMGEAIITGVIAGLDATKDTLYGKLTDIASTLYGIGNKVFGLQADALERNIDATTDQMTAAFDSLRGTFGDNVVDNLLRMSESDRAYFVAFLKGSSAYQNNVEVQRNLDEAIRLANERNGLEAEYIRQQEELAALEEQRGRLDFLQTQVELLDLIRENNLSANILDGLTLGLDASMTDILAAMTEATRQLIERANDELQIASPSAVFRRIGERVMEGLADGLAHTRDVQRRMGAAMDGMVGLGMADTRALQGRLQAGLNQAIRVDARGINPTQSVNIYGGYNVALEGRPSTDPLRELYFAGLGYQRG